VGKPEGKRPVEDLGIDGRVLKLILNRIERCGLVLSGSGYGQVAGFCECCNEPSGTIKGGETLI